MLAYCCRRLVRICILGGTLGGVLTACDQPTGVVPAEAVGTYRLVSVNGGRLPALVAATTERQVEIVSGELVVLFGGLLREERVSHITDSSGTTADSAVMEGTLHVRGSALEVHAEGGARYAGFYAHSPRQPELSFTVPVAGGEITFTYRQNSGR